MEEVCSNCQYWKMTFGHSSRVCTYWYFAVHRRICSSGYGWHVASEVDEEAREDVNSNYICLPTPGDFGCNRWKGKWEGPFALSRGELAFRGEDGNWREKLSQEDTCEWLNELWHRWQVE